LRPQIASGTLLCGIFGPESSSGVSVACETVSRRLAQARLARGEGDAERLREVRGRLRAEAALARQQPLLEDKLPMLFQVVTAGKNRSRLAEALGGAPRPGPIHAEPGRPGGSSRDSSGASSRDSKQTPTDNPRKPR
jgi:hypothetical protein